MLDKTLVHSTALELITGKLNGIQREFDSLQEALMSETKSSAGDKHETGRAMAQLEQEKLSRQLSETRKSLDGLKQIDPGKEMNEVAFGSLVQTNRGYFFVSVGIGQITVNEVSVVCITAGSPLGQKILNKTKGDMVEMNGTLVIENIF